MTTMLSRRQALLGSAAAFIIVDAVEANAALTGTTTALPATMPSVAVEFPLTGYGLRCVEQVLQNQTRLSLHTFIYVDAEELAALEAFAKSMAGISLLCNGPELYSQVGPHPTGQISIADTNVPRLRALLTDGVIRLRPDHVPPVAAHVKWTFGDGPDRRIVGRVAA